MKLYVKTGTFKNIFHIPGSKFQGLFSMEAGTPKISPAAHLYHLHVGTFPPGHNWTIEINIQGMLALENFYGQLAIR